MKDTEYDRFISDQSALLDELYLEYENILNTRLDDTNALISNVITEVNANASTISNTLTTETRNVGMTISNSLKEIWNGDGESIKSVLSTNNNAIIGKEETTIRGLLDNIKKNVDAMTDDIDKESQNKVNKPKTNTSAVTNPTGSSNGGASGSNAGSALNTKKVNEDTLMGIASAIWVYGSESGWGNNPFRENKLTNKLGAENAKKVQDYVNKYGSSGKLYSFWLKKNKNLSAYKYNAFKFGAKNIDETQFAWTQENGREFIVRPSDGAILTPIAKGDSVLTSAASSNIWDMANSPAEFIKDNLSFGAANVPNNSNVQNVYHQNLDKIVISLPNVHNYQEFMSEMQKDKNFKRLITSMTINQIAGKSSLAINKAIR